MGLQEVAFLPSSASFYTTFLKIVVDNKTSGPVLRASKRMLDVKYFHSNKSLLCQLNLMETERLLQS